MKRGDDDNPTIETFNTPSGQPEASFTMDHLIQAARLLGASPPDPLGGADTLYYADNMKDAAKEIVRIRNAARYRYGPHMMTCRSPMVLPGFILAVRGSQLVAVIDEHGGCKPAPRGWLHDILTERRKP